MLHRVKFFVLVVFILSLGGSAVLAQTSTFTYQGKLNDGAMPASGSYLVRFRLFDAVAVGSQLGPVLDDVPVQAVEGIVAARLDFGAGALTGADRYLEISIRRNTGESYVTLTPRDRITSAPYAVKSANAATADLAANSTQLGGVAANQYVQTNDSRLTDARTPTAGSNDYIQNQIEVVQNSNLRISGVALVGRLDSRTSGSSAAVYAENSGNGEGVHGVSASGVGIKGQSTSGRGVEGTSTNNVGVFGSSSNNAGVAGISNSNTAVSGTSTSGIGVQGNSISGDGVGGSSTSAAGVFGIGINQGSVGLYSQGTSWFRGDTTPLNALNAGVGTGIAIGSGGSLGYIFAFDYSGGGGTRTLALNGPGGNVGIGTTTPARTLHVNGRVRIQLAPPEASVVGMCFTNQGDVVQCGASSLRLKRNVSPFTSGLDIVRKLRPIAYDWRDGSGHDVGLGAEDVAAVAPQFAFNDDKGETAGVKYERLSILLINAVKEQQVQIEEQRKALAKQQRQINSLLRAAKRRR